MRGREREEGASSVVRHSECNAIPHSLLFLSSNGLNPPFNFYLSLSSSLVVILAAAMVESAGLLFHTPGQRVWVSGKWSNSFLKSTFRDNLCSDRPDLTPGMLADLNAHCRRLVEISEVCEAKMDTEIFARMWPMKLLPLNGTSFEAVISLLVRGTDGSIPTSWDSWSV